MAKPASPPVSGEQPLAQRARPKSKQGAEDAGRVQDQAVFQVYHEVHRKVQQDQQSQRVSQAGRGRHPNVNTDCGQKHLNDPDSWFSPFSARTAGAQKEIILPRGGGVAVLAGGLAEAPRGRQNVGQVIDHPAADPAHDQRDDQTGFHAFIIFQTIGDARAVSDL